MTDSKDIESPSTTGILAGTRVEPAGAPDEAAPASPVEVEAVPPGDDERTPASPPPEEALALQRPDQVARQLAFLRGSEVEGDVEEALVRLKAATLLEDLYDARSRLLKSRSAMAMESARAHEQLESRARIFMKSVESARRLSGSATSIPSPTSPAAGTSAALAGAKDADPYSGFLDAAKGSLKAAEEELDARDRAADDLFKKSLAEAEDRIRRHVEDLLANHAPTVSLTLQPVGATHAVAWIDRPGADDAVLLYALLAGRLPSRYDALFDDSVDDPTLPAPDFFPEDGYDPRPATVDESDEAAARPLEAGAAVPFVPFKAFIPLRIPGVDFPRFRLSNQGPVIQVLGRGEGDAYQPLMPVEAAEMAAGLFIRLQVEGRIKLAFQAM